MEYFLIAALIADVAQQSVVTDSFLPGLLSGIATIIAAVGGVLWGRRGVNEKLEKQEKELRTSIANELRTSITNDPLNVDTADKFVTRGECKRLMCAHDAALTELRSDVKTGNINILHKLEAMDRKSEERAIAAHSRIEPLVKEISKNIGQVELMKEGFLRAAAGGKK